MTATLAVSATADLYARLDGLRTFTERALADECRSSQTVLELVGARLAGLCAEAPSWCPGCDGRGDGTVCRVCGAPVPAALRSRPGQVLAS
jgi:hypothetical protein